MSDRAVQFAAFAALKGYYELISDKERVRVERRELTEQSADELSRKMNLVKRGMIINVVYYSDGEYISRCGMVSMIDTTLRKLRIVKTEISFDDVYDISGESIPSDF